MKNKICYIQFHKDGTIYIQFDKRFLDERKNCKVGAYEMLKAHDVVIFGKVDKIVKRGIIMSKWQIVKE